MLATRFGLALTCATLVACAPDPKPAPQSVTVSGTIAGGVPAGSKALLLFLVETQAGEGLYKWGEGTSADGSTYGITVSPPPPPGALLVSSDAGSMAIGFVWIVPSTIDLPDGLVADPAALGAALLGASKREAIIWRTGTTGIGWPDDFPEGTLSCGTCVDAAVGFDTFTPASCDAVGVSTNAADPSCNWS